MPKPKKKIAAKPRRQATWQKRMLEAGRCTRCGQPKGESPYSRTCVRCAAKRRDEQRRARGGGAWSPGGMGRPPKFTT